MRRRDFALGAAALALSPISSAQARVPVIGWIGSAGPYDPKSPARVATFEALAEAGYIDGKTVLSEYGFSEGHDDRLPAIAEEHVRRGVAVIATTGNPSSALAAKRATDSIPIVFFTGGDPISAGLVTSLAHPEANVTGLTLISGELNRKRLELLHEQVPGLKVLGIAVNRNNPRTEILLGPVAESARAGGLRIEVVRPGDKSELDPAFAALAAAGAQAVFVMSDALFIGNQQAVVDAVARYRLPATYESRDFVVRGGLMSYGADLVETARRFGVYIGWVLNGTKPADLPVEEPVKFDLAINMTTAKALGLAIPPSILVRAEIIE